MVRIPWHDFPRGYIEYGLLKKANDNGNAIWKRDDGSNQQRKWIDVCS